MDIIVAKRAGFCFGVRRAVEIAFKVAEHTETSAVTLGPIIHNPQVIERLRESGISAVDSAPSQRSTVIIRTHGIDRRLQAQLAEAGHSVIDATCPFVKKAQQYAKLLSEDGYQVIILGDSDHPEVKGIVSYAREDAVVVSEESGLPPLRKKVGIVVQTTQSPDALQHLVGRILGKVKELKVYNTICNSTALRLRETEAIARKADIVLVVGGRNSANTGQLARRASKCGARTYHIETASDIQREWFEGVGHVYLRCGAAPT
ncbi:MAG: 4-hydroxy-3-methylbut-2-enyl diphosphate reductase, partial [Thermodesulfovibrionales bacterium]